MLMMLALRHSLSITVISRSISSIFINMTITPGRSNPASWTAVCTGRLQKRRSFIIVLKWKPAEKERQE